MTWRRIIALGSGMVVVALVALVRSRNPEHRPLDSAGRADAPGAFVTLSDGVTHYRVEGPDSGARVMLVHGFSVPSYIWDSTAIALVAAGYRVARYDSFGRGFSDRPDTDYGLDLYVRQLRDVLDSLGWQEPVHLMGLSFGGPVTAAFTARHAARVRSLTLVDPAAGPQSTLPWFLRLPGLGPVLWQAMAVPGMAQGQLTDFVEPGEWPDWPDRYRVQMQYRGFGRSLLRTIRAGEGMVFDSIYVGIGSAKTPTLLIWGKEDLTVRIELAEGVRKAIPQAEFHVIERAGHLPHMERTDVVNPLLLRFLGSTQPTTQGAAETREPQ